MCLSCSIFETTAQPYSEHPCGFDFIFLDNVGSFSLIIVSLAPFKGICCCCCCFRMHWQIGHFRITSGLFFEASPGTLILSYANQFLFTSKLNSFACELNLNRTAENERKYIELSKHPKAGKPKNKHVNTSSTT